MPVSFRIHSMCHVLFKRNTEFCLPVHILFLLASPMFTLLIFPSVSPESLLRVGHGPTDSFQIGKGVRQGCILSPCLFNLCAEFIIREMQIKTTMGYHLNPIRIAIIKKFTNSKCYRGAFIYLLLWRKGNPPTLLVGM